MKSIITFVLFLFCMAFKTIKGQEIQVPPTMVQETSESKMGIIASGGIGYVTFLNKSHPNYNLNSNGAEFLLNIRIADIFGLATGFGYYKLSGNGFNPPSGVFYEERSLHKVPLLLTINLPVAEKLKILANLGFYIQNISKDEFQFMLKSEEDVFEGWNYGAQIEVGFLFKISEALSAGMNFSGQSDLFDIEASKSQDMYSSYIETQRLKNLISVGVIVEIAF